MTLEMVSADEVHIVFSGNTKPFQAGFVDMKIKGQSVKHDPSDMYGEYYRVMPNQSLEPGAGTTAQLKRILGEGVLHSSPLVIRAKPAHHGTALSKEMLAGLITEPNVKFALDL